MVNKVVYKDLYEVILLQNSVPPSNPHILEN